MPPVNDDLANARVITADITYVGETTVGATNEGPATPGHEAYDYALGVSVWYRLEWSGTGKWRVHVNNADYNWGTTGYYISGSDPPAWTDLSYYSPFSYNQITTPPEHWMQTQELTAGTVVYIRFSCSDPNYVNLTGTFDIGFEFITSPYNPGSPPANDDMQNAVVLGIPSAATAGTTHGATEDAGAVWYRWEPSVDVVITVTIEGTEGGSPWMPYGDMYHLDGADPPTGYGDLSNDGWYQFLGDRDFATTGLPLNPGYASFSLTGGEVYLMEVYDFANIFNGTFTIKTEIGKAPTNDRIDNAQFISPSSTFPQIITGTTVYGSQDYDEVINYDGSMTPSVWYVLDMQGPGEMSVIIESLTDGWIAQFDTFYKTADHTQAGVTGMDQLTQDGSRTTKDTRPTVGPPSPHTLDNAMYYGDIFNPAGSNFVWDPLVGGEKFYLRVTGYNDDGQYDAGRFRLTVFVAPPAVCLSASSYINGASTTASIVSGNVRETQYIDLDHGGISPYTKTGYEGWLDTQTATLIIPGADIAATPGLYSVQLKYTNGLQSYNWVAGFRRNGQPLEPGAELSASAGADFTDWMTMMAGAPRPNELDMIRYLPVQPGDTIQVVLAANTYGNNTYHLDLVSVCFQRMLNAKEGKPYSQIDIPDYPLGTSVGDLGTNDQQGDLMLYKDTPSANDYTQHRSTNADIVTTSDGTLWCLASWTCDGFTGPRIGPALQKWNGSSWVVVNDDIGGFGVKRAYGTTTVINGWSLSMDTDGEDIWVCYCIDGGINGPGTTHSTHLKVRKYDVSGNSWSDVGSPFHGSRSDVGSATVAAEYAVAVAGDFGETPIIRVSPAGVPWVVFTDAFCPATSPEDFAFWQMRHYVARWTGSTWAVDVLPPPYEATDDYTVYKQQAESATLGGTSTSTTYLGVSCVEDTQTTFTNDTISWTPAAGKWCFKSRLAKDHVSGGTTGVEANLYKNGTLVGAVGGSGLTSTDLAWSRFGFLRPWVDCNGSDVMSVRLRKTGTGVAHVYIDEVVWIDAHRVEENTGYGLNARFVDDGQPQAMLYMHQVGDVGMGENPGVLYMTPYTRPFLTTAERDAGEPPTGYASLAELDLSNNMVLPAQTTGNYLWNWQTWLYAEWDGSQWVKKWNQLIEEHAGDHMYLQTLLGGPASVPPVGHFQQGFGGCTNGIDNYMTANLGGGQPFGFFGDTILALKIGLGGFVPFTDGPPAALQGAGYPQGLVLGLAGFSGWGWDTAGRSIHVDVNGNVWLAWNGTEGATFNYSEFVAVAGNDGITGNKGLCGWFAAADSNESLGGDNTYMPVGHVVSSPSGDTIYILFDAFIWSAPGAPTEPYTFGVYECPVLADNHIPLLPVLAGVVSMNWRSSDRQPSTIRVLVGG